MRLKGVLSISSSEGPFLTQTQPILSNSGKQSPVLCAAAQVCAERAIAKAPWCSYKFKYLHLVLLLGVQTGTHALQQMLPRALWKSACPLFVSAKHQPGYETKPNHKSKAICFLILKDQNSITAASCSYLNVFPHHTNLMRQISNFLGVPRETAVIKSTFQHPAHSTGNVKQSRCHHALA